MTARYDDDQVRQLQSGLLEVRQEISSEVHALLGRLGPTLESDHANEYLQHGVCRRLHVMSRCVENVFSLYPPERSELLAREARYDLEISLHAFISHLVGVLDNMAWVFVFERSLNERIHKNDVGIFNKKTQVHMKTEFREHLSSDELTTWWKEYAKNYRDALAHRIPLYVAPSVLLPGDASLYEELERKISDAQLAGHWRRANDLQDEQERLGEIVDCFTHSFSDASARSIRFHPQTLADTRTVLEISRKLRAELESDA